MRRRNETYPTFAFKLETILEAKAATSNSGSSDKVNRTYTNNAHIYTHIFTHTHTKIHTYAHTHTHACTHRSWTCTHTSMHMHAHAKTLTHAHACTCTRTITCTCTCTLFGSNGSRLLIFPTNCLCVIGSFRLATFKCLGDQVTQRLP